MISKPGLLDLIRGKPKDVQQAALAWYRVARCADWACFAGVREHFPAADLVDGLLVFNVRRNRYRLIVYPVFSRRKLYVKALLNHKEYERGDRRNRWP